MNPFIILMFCVALGFAIKEYIRHIKMSWDAPLRLHREYHLMTAMTLGAAIGVFSAMFLLTFVI